jgi:hypothetical protein
MLYKIISCQLLYVGVKRYLLFPGKNINYNILKINYSGERRDLEGMKQTISDIILRASVIYEGYLVLLTAYVV